MNKYQYGDVIDCWNDGDSENDHDWYQVDAESHFFLEGQMHEGPYFLKKIFTEDPLALLSKKSNASYDTPNLAVKEEIKGKYDHVVKRQLKMELMGIDENGQLKPLFEY